MISLLLFVHCEKLGQSADRDDEVFNDHKDSTDSVTSVLIGQLHVSESTSSTDLISSG